MSGPAAALPAFVDEHRTTVAAPPDQVWPVLRRYVDRALVRGHASGPTRLLTRALGTEPASGFAVAEEEPGTLLALTGRHRFSRYRLVFVVAPAGPGASTVVAETWADFPGPHGAAYRLLVITSRAHAVAVRRMLRAVREGAAG